MTAYRDSFENCPRCKVALVDARSARGCEQCQGLWLEEPVLAEMVQTMLPPQPHGALVLAVLQRSGERLPCPTCGDPMHPTEIYGVELDRCPKHGVWFDKPELEVALRRIAEPTSRPPPAAPTTRAAAPMPITHAPSPPAAPSAAPPRPWPTTFYVTPPGPYPRTHEVKLNKPVIKIGRLPSADIVLQDMQVARMHALIELNGLSDVTLYDLGSSEGTLLNGKTVNKAKLQDGDTMQLGATKMRIAIGK